MKKHTLIIFYFGLNGLCCSFQKLKAFSKEYRKNHPLHRKIAIGALIYTIISTPLLFALPSSLENLSSLTIAAQTEAYHRERQEKEMEEKLILERTQIKERDALMDVLKSQESIERFLMEKSAQNIQALLQTAIIFSDVEKVQFIVKNSSVNINAKTDMGTPFLHLAVMRWQQNMDMLRFFFHHPGIDLNVVNEWGDNLFHSVFFLTESERLSILNFLFKPEHLKKIKKLLNAVNIFEETPMDFLVRDMASKVSTNEIITKHSYSIYQIMQNKGARYGISKASQMEGILQKARRLNLAGLPGKFNRRSCRNAWVY